MVCMKYVMDELRRANGNKKSAPLPGRIGCGELGNANVYSAHLAGILRVGFGVICHLLALGQLFKAVTLDDREMDEYVPRPVVVGDKSKALVLVEPFHSTVIHKVPPQ